MSVFVDDGVDVYVRINPKKSFDTSGVRAITVTAHFSHIPISSMLCYNVLRLPQTREQSSLPPVIIIVFPGN